MSATTPSDDDPRPIDPGSSDNLSGDEISENPLSDSSDATEGNATESSDAVESDNESSDATDAFAHADDDSIDSSSAVDLGGACPLEPELPLLLYEGELDADDRERLEAHIRKCARCEGAFAELKATASALDKSPVVAPRAEKWTKLKTNVLKAASDVSEALPAKGEPAKAEPAKAEPAKTAPKGRPSKIPTRVVAASASDERRAAAAVKSPATSGSTTPSEAVAAVLCGAFEEDFLFLGELEGPRRTEVLAHLQGCSHCRETKGAFASVGQTLDSVEVVFPAIDKWDAVKANVLAQVGIQTATRERPAAAAKKTALVPAQPLVLDSPSTGRRVGGFFLKVASVVAVFALGVYSSDALRSAGPEAILAAKYKADASSDFAFVLGSYELVVRDGANRPEVKRERDDALVQLAALNRYASIASSNLSSDFKRVEFVKLIAQFPESRAAALAIDSYTRLLQSAKPEDVVKNPGKTGFDLTGGPGFQVNTEVVVISDPVTSSNRFFAFAKEKFPEGQPAPREFQTVFAAAKLQKVIGEKNVETARAPLEEIVQGSDPTSPIGLAAQRRLDLLLAAGGN